VRSGSAEGTVAGCSNIDVGQLLLLTVVFTCGSGDIGAGEMGRDNNMVTSARHKDANCTE